MLGFRGRTFQAKESSKNKGPEAGMWYEVRRGQRHGPDHQYLIGPA